MKKKFKLTDLLIFIISTELVGALSSMFSGGRFSEYYSSLTKPPIAPPGWVFPAAWALLYALMAAACYLVYLSDSVHRDTALKLYVLQLFVNFLWSPVFFGAGSFGGAVIIAAVLLVTVALTTIAFFRISDLAGMLFLPYLIWSAYGLYLSVGFLVLNK